jgi:serine/threonine-protein kinase HipA
MAWEKTALDLAAGGGIDIPKHRLVRIGSSSVLLLERFDRAGSTLEGARIPYMSAMTALCAIEISRFEPTFAAGMRRLADCGL